LFFSYFLFTQYYSCRVYSHFQSMLAARRAPAHSVSRYVTSTFASASTHSGRTAAYRRLNTLSTLPKSHRENVPRLQRSTSLSSRYAPPPVASLVRPFHYSAPRPQDPKPTDDIRDPPRPAEPAETSEQKTSEEPKSEQSQEGEKKDGEGKKKEEAPPPPHGDKTPWQVFTETLRTEFKASQEWQDSTKQLAGEVKAFNESDSVRKAREASSAVTGGARKVVRGTGEVVGKGVSFAWNTSAVQGVRAGVNATGRGLEKASRPIRETQAFKDLSDALDDGSSARYGGWTEREERKRLREQREQERLTRGGKPIEPMVENPE
jgi:mitochondrial import inner membrane translocase subunit TIM44